MGVDHSAKTIEFLALELWETLQDVQLGTCDFCEAGLDLGRVFDAVYSSDVLEHVTDARAFVHNIHRHLRVGGKAVINFPNEETHGINHFKEVDDLRKLFAAFSDVKAFTVEINHPLDKLWFSVRALYENLFSRSTKEARDRLYSGREEQGIDFFEDSTCFKFVNNKSKGFHWTASILAEAFLSHQAGNRNTPSRAGNILNRPRLIVAVK
jgi:SAM-dependent methyltransferase